MPLKTQGNDISNPANPKRLTGPAISSISGSPLLSKAPPRQDSSYFSTQPDSDNDSTKAAEARAVTIYRKKVRRTKRVTWDRRGELNDLRKAFQDVADAFVQQVNRAVAFNNIREELEPYQERIRDAQDTLAAAEHAYDELERRLRREEDELEREEIRFYGYSESPTSSDLDADVSPIKETELQPTTHFEDDLKQVYLQKVSEAHYLREDLDNLEEDYYQFSTEAELRHKLGVRTSAETTEFCSAYRQRHTDIIGELERVETHLPSLRLECLKRGLFNEDEHIYKPHDALYEDIMDSIDEALERYPLRLAETQRHHLRRLDYENKTEYVNNWLLNWVESSSYECSVLKEWIISTYRTSIGHASELDHRWSDLALQNWNTDSAGIDANNHNKASMLDVITGDTGKLNEKMGIVNASRSISTGSSLDLDDLSRIGSLLTGGDDVPWVDRNPSTPGIRRMKRPTNFWDLE
ncbi:hypothetical protein HYFRA_00005477 [Hymenoscyphus fraxineus]|uniref:Uncharacterized protein n=1 Tax=Hymenoscyphus fraxineus TaxID=746836 RepID=A0A9N9KTF3_9HELO|nr:hypothetical protein HYFRA_00005477 [Hymenoscyphus fraxineus]